MKFTVSDLDRNQISSLVIDERLDISAMLSDYPRFLGIDPLLVKGHAYYERETAQLIVDLSLTGRMQVPCAITLRPVDWDFKIRYMENFAFEGDHAEEFEAIYIDEDELDLLPYIVDTIVAEIPLKMVDPDFREYPKGEGWSVLSEAMYQEEKENEIDPRLAILKDYKVE